MTINTIPKMSKDPTAIFMDHIRDHATQYFTGFESTQVKIQFEEKQERMASTLYRFTVADKVQNHGILVKVPNHGGHPVSESGGAPYYKPRLFPRTEPKDMHRLEYSALRTIYEYFSGLGEKQLGTIRVLDYLPGYQAILEEESRDPGLRELFLKNSRLHLKFRRPELDLPFQNVGRWLRYYHEMCKEDDVKVRHAYRHEYIEAVTKLTAFLTAALAKKTFFQHIASVLEDRALRILPDMLPLGLGHGDFALRNILVGSNARITVIDTFAKWRTPIYEDIGYFLNGLKMPALQVVSQGLAFSSDQLRAYESAFLKGYFGTKAIPYSAIRLYEILALLDKWSSAMAYYHQRSAKFKLLGRARVMLTNGYFKRSTKSLLKEIIEG